MTCTTAPKARSRAWATEPGMQPFRPVKVFFHRAQWSVVCPECLWTLSATSLYREAAEKAWQHAHRGCPVRGQAAGWRPCGWCHGLGTTPDSFLGTAACRHCDGRGGRPTNY